MNSSVFPRTLVFPCQKEVQEREINTLIVQFTNDYLTKTFFHNDESGVDYSTVDADSMCTWEKVKFESVFPFKVYFKFIFFLNKFPILSLMNMMI